MPTPVFPSDVPPPHGHYAPAVRHGDLLYLSGTLPDQADAPFAEQMQQLIGKCSAVLAAGGSDAQRIVSLTVYLTDLDNWEAADAALAAWCGAHLPARVMLQAPAIRYGCAVQVTMVAAV